MMANNSGILRLFGANIVVGHVADHQVQKSSVELCIAGTLSVNTAASTNSDSTVNNPTPLRRFMPQPNGVEKTLRGNPRKRKRDNVKGGERKKRSTKKGKDSTTPLVPLEEIPSLMKQVEDRNGIMPVFLYGKELEESDVRKGQNRLFVNKREKFEELFGLEDLKGGKEVEGVDGGGNTYKLGLVIWNSLQKLAVKKEWRKLVEKNGAKKGDWVQVWGFRVGEDPKPCLAIHFMEPNDSASGAISSNNGGN